jgi:hypothetical protein
MTPQAGWQADHQAAQTCSQAMSYAEKTKRFIQCLVVQSFALAADEPAEWLGDAGTCTAVGCPVWWSCVL